MAHRSLERGLEVTHGYPVRPRPLFSSIQLHLELVQQPARQLHE
jgi:hypothetical protein